MADREDSFYSAAMDRILRWMLVLGGGGAVVLFAWRGWQWGCGYALGAAASWINFRWLKKLVDSLAGAAGGRAPKKRVAIVLGLRYLLLGAGAYVILKFSEISLTASLIGIFMSAAAVILEILYQLIFYAGT